MRLFLINSIKFLLPVVFLLVSMEILIRRIPNDYEYKANYLNENKSSINTLILGNSHAFRAINPAYLDGHAFNMANVSQTFDVDYEILEYYKSQMPKLKTIVLTISYSTLFTVLNITEEKWRGKNYYIYIGLKSFFTLRNSLELTSNTMKVNVNRLYKYYICGKKNRTCDSLGFSMFKPGKGKSKQKSGVTAAKRHTKNVNSLLTQMVFLENTRNIKKLSRWCEMEKVSLVLITPPAYHTYTRNLNLEQLALTVDFCTKLDQSSDYVIYANFLMHKDFVESDFYDADHVNNNGAGKFSIKLNEVINEQK